jgi:hypothetical protein
LCPFCFAQIAIRRSMSMRKILKIISAQGY